MKKVGILTFYYRNYGGVLQAYALSKTVDSLGYISEIMSYDNGVAKNPIYSNMLVQCKQYSIAETFGKIAQRVIEKSGYFFIKDIIKKRTKCFNSFAKNNVRRSSPYNDETLYKSMDEFFAYISGSDQVWNPNSVRMGYLQSFVDDMHIKISYAASISREMLSKKEANVLIPAINRFNYISVREKTAQRILNDAGLNDIEVTLDPTFLLDAKKWEDISSPRIEKEKYALCYFFSNSFKCRKKIQVFCKENNLKMLFIPYAKQTYNFSDSVGKGVRIEDVGPSEFLSLIKNAQYVFTDSFHGAVFSIIFKKEFLLFERDKNNTTSKNSRIYDLLDTFGLRQQLVNINADFNEVLDKRIDYKEVIKTLDEKRSESIGFLTRALGHFKK